METSPFSDAHYTLKVGRRKQWTPRTGDKVLKNSRIFTIIPFGVERIRFDRHLKIIDIDNELFSFQFAFLSTCFESDFDDAHECRSYSRKCAIKKKMSCLLHLSIVCISNVNESRLLTSIIHIQRLQTVFSIEIKHFIFIGSSSRFPSIGNMW